jgi:hypothetical protein
VLSFIVRIHSIDDEHVDATVRSAIHALTEEGAEIFDHFDRTVRDKEFHPFVPADYTLIIDALETLRHSDRLPRRAGPPTFLELGSGTGVIAIIADLLGFDAVGIELDAELVAIARGLAARHNSRARFVAGSFIPTGYKWRPSHGDARMGTIGSGPSAYMELGHALDDFDVVYAYPWDGEMPIMRDLLEKYGNPGAHLMLMDPVEGLRIVPPRQISI